MTRLTRLFLLSLSIGILVLGSNANASIINGSFEPFGLASWTTVGPNSAVPNGTINGFNATDGSEYAYLHTGVGAQSVLIQDFVLQSLGLGPNYIATNFAGAREGSILYQTFTLDPGCNELRFDWNFLTSEGGNVDFAFARLFDAGFSLANPPASLDTNSPLVGGLPDYLLHTGWQTVSFAGLTPGNTYTLVFGVFDDRDFVNDSALLVDRVQCVPEPSGALLSLVGLSMLRLRRRVVR